jgi:two-component system OmpR family sensor kinase
MKVAEKLPLAFADIGLCERVIENLIDNALRYTPEGGSIIVEALPEEERITVKVSDTGSGIPPEDIPHLFDRFSRRGRNGEDSTSGSGLGLIISKRILELHGSDIEVRSIVNVGTTISFSLPVYHS